MHGGAHSSSAFALPPRITQPPAIDLSNLTKDDLLQLNDVEKDAAILRLSKTVRGMEERRGHRIDKAEFAKWEAEIAEQKQAATAADARAVGAEANAKALESVNRDQRAEIMRLKRLLARMEDEAEAAAAVAARRAQKEQEKEGPAAAAAAASFSSNAPRPSPETRSVGTATAAPPAFVDAAAQTTDGSPDLTATATSPVRAELMEPAHRDAQAQTDPPPPPPTEKGSSSSSSGGGVGGGRGGRRGDGSFHTVHSDMFMAEMTAMFHILGAIKGGGGDGASVSNNPEDAWKHTCSFGPIAALASLKQRAKECQGEMDLLRSMVSNQQMRKQEARQFQQQQQQRLQQVVRKPQQSQGHMSFYQPQQPQQHHFQGLQQQQQGGGVLPAVARGKSGRAAVDVAMPDNNGQQNRMARPSLQQQQQQQQPQGSQGRGIRSGRTAVQQQQQQQQQIQLQQKLAAAEQQQKRLQYQQQQQQQQAGEGSTVHLAFPSQQHSNSGNSSIRRVI